METGLLVYGDTLRRRTVRISDYAARLNRILHEIGSLLTCGRGNAEHAVRAFTRLRNVINTSSPKGTRDYATLLSIQQTLRYRGREFLEFMRSGEMEIPE